MRPLGGRARLLKISLLGALKNRKMQNNWKQDERDILKKRAEELSRRIVEPDVDEYITVVIFAIGGEEYAIDVKYVLQTQKLRYIAKMPSTPDFIAGIMNMGGSMLPVIDLRVLMGFKAEIKNENPIFIMDVNGNRMGALVDEIKDVIFIPKRDVKPPLESISEGKRLYTYGEAFFDNKMIVILKAEELFSTNRLSFK